MSIGSTYIRLPHKFAYLSLITDGYSKKIVGWSLQETMHSKGPVAALKMALSKYTEADQELIHHSDRGLQYCCHEYIKLLKNITISMTHDGDRSITKVTLHSSCKVTLVIDPPLENRKIVEEIRYSYYSLGQASKKYILSNKNKLQKSVNQY